MLLVSRLPVCDQPVLRQQHKKVLRIEAGLNRRVHDEHMAHVLLPAADLVLALEDQDTARLQHPVRFPEHIRIALMQALLIRVHSKAPVDPVTVPGCEAFPLGRQKRRIEHHAAYRLIRQWKMSGICFHNVLCLRMDIKPQRRRFYTGPVIKSPGAEGRIAVDFSLRHMEPQNVPDDLPLVIADASDQIRHPIHPFAWVIRRLSSPGISRIHSRARLL